VFFIVGGHPSKTSGQKEGCVCVIKSGRPRAGGGSTIERISTNATIFCILETVLVSDTPSGPCPFPSMDVRNAKLFAFRTFTRDTIRTSVNWGLGWGGVLPNGPYWTGGSKKSLLLGRLWCRTPYLNPTTPGYKVNKYADDCYLLGSSSNSLSIPFELNHINPWAISNNICLKCPN